MKFRTKRSEVKSFILSKGGDFKQGNHKIDVYSNLSFSGYRTLNISYLFENGLMTAGFADIPFAPIIVFCRYIIIVSGVIGKYGKPSGVEEKYITPYAQGDRFKITAIKNGKALFETSWYFKDVFISESITDDLSILIIYSNPDSTSIKTDY